MLAPVETTYSLTYLIDALNDHPPAVSVEEIPPQGDNVSQHVRVASRSNIFSGIAVANDVDYYILCDDLIGRTHFASQKPVVRSGWKITSTTDLTLKQRDLLAPVRKDPWVEVALNEIGKFRYLDADWDGGANPPPSTEALDAAELLAAGFSVLPMNRRPQFIVDTEGAPSFTAYNDEHYLHMTISPSGTLTWFRVVGDQEYFGDDVEIITADVEQLVRDIIPA